MMSGSLTRSTRSNPRKSSFRLAAAGVSVMLTLGSILFATAGAYGAPEGAASGQAPVVLSPADVADDQQAQMANMVVPRLSEWSSSDNTVQLNARTRILLDPKTARSWTTGATQPGLSQQTGDRVARQFANELEAITGLHSPVSRGVASASGHDILFSLVSDPELGAEGYRLDIGSGPTTVEANTSTGLYYGTRTLEQMLQASADGRTLTAGTALDTPDQPMRQVMLDAGRKYWEIDYLKNLIRQMSWNKLNTLYLQFSDSEGFRLDSPKFPGLADPDVSYDKAEIEDLVAFAAEHHVMLVPGIDIPGHATVISDAFQTGFGDYANACTNAHMHSHLTIDWVVDITEQRTYDITTGLLEEFLPWFDAPYAHLGADELPGQLGNCPKVQQYLAADPELSTLGDLATDFINRMDRVVAEHGKRSIIYNGVEHMASPQQDVNEDVIFMTWEGTGSEPIINGHDEIAVGPFYLTPNNYHSLYPDEAWMYDEWVPSVAGDMLGSGLMNWADYNFWAKDQHFEQLMTTPRAILADRSWNASPTPDGVQDFKARLGAIGTPPGLTVSPAPQRVNDAKASHHWTFEPAPYPSGWTYAGSQGQTLFVGDEAGELHGTSYIINNPEHIDDGIEGSAFRFNNDRDGVGFGGLDTAPPWTISAWVRTSAQMGDSSLLSSGETAIKLQQYQTCGRVGFTEKGVADHSFDYSTPLNEWVHLTMVAGPEQISLYVNGELRDVADASVNLPMRSIGDLGSGIRGDLDEIKVYDEALRAEEIAGAYEAYGVQGSDNQMECLNNAALGKAAEQSSTANNGVAARAVDGNTNGSFGGQSVTHTAENGSPEPYWQVDLETNVSISEIGVWNRTDCCGSRLDDYYVLVSDEPFVSTDLDEVLAQSGVTAFEQTQPAGSPTRIDTDDLQGRYVRVQLRGNAVLSLAELQVLTTDS
ncbi:hypothetical protein GCM10027403_07310 [Arthrobacter tecti]